MPFLCRLVSLAVTAAVAAEAAPAPGSSQSSSRRDAMPLPSFATAFAPVSYLHSSESWWPSDIATHLQNTVPEVAFAAVAGYEAAGSVTLATLDTVPASAYLTSRDDVDSSPAWQLSAYGKPTTADGGYSAAPGTIIAVQKNATWVDVFYFYFYSYNHGGAVLGIQFDDHVGDWEHTMIRFVNGQPTAMYFSQHGAGSAYTWAALAKGSGARAGRPLTYIGLGGHANYAKPGQEDYTIALGLVSDKTDAGYAWDMAQNYRGYWYDAAAGTFSPAGGAGIGQQESESDQGAWLQWTGYWGDQQYAASRKHQYCIATECHYTSGPSGPVAKNLGRAAVCQDEDDCTVFRDIDDLTHQSKRTI